MLLLLLLCFFIDQCLYRGSLFGNDIDFFAMPEQSCAGGNQRFTLLNAIADGRRTPVKKSDGDRTLLGGQLLLIQNKDCCGLFPVIYKVP